MSKTKLDRIGVAAVLIVGALAGAAGGYVTGRQIVTTRPTCTNAVNNYFAVIPEQQRELLERFGAFGRDAHVRTCREGRWSESMKSCWVHASSTVDIDVCPNEWLNATTICEQMKREATGLARRCHIDSGNLDCAPVRGLGPGIKQCIESLRDAECNEVEQARKQCEGVLSSPS